MSDNDDTTYAPEVDASSVDESSCSEKDQNLNIFKGIARIALHHKAFVLMITIVTFFVLKKSLKVSLLKEMRNNAYTTVLWWIFWFSMIWTEMSLGASLCTFESQVGVQVLEILSYSWFYKHAFFVDLEHNFQDYRRREGLCDSGIGRLVFNKYPSAAIWRRCLIRRRWKFVWNL